MRRLICVFAGHTSYCKVCCTLAYFRLWNVMIGGAGEQTVQIIMSVNILSVRIFSEIVTRSSKSFRHTWSPDIPRFEHPKYPILIIWRETDTSLRKTNNPLLLVSDKTKRQANRITNVNQLRMILLWNANYNLLPKWSYMFLCVLRGFTVTLGDLHADWHFIICIGGDSEFWSL